MEYTKREAKKYAKENMRGLWSASSYPFRKDLDLDEKGLVSDLRHFIDDLQIDGFYMGGIINEFWSLTVEERKRAQELLIREAAGAIRTVTMCGHTCIRTAIELTKHAEKAGADFACLINPFYAAGTPELIYDYFRAITDAVDIGILILNSPTAGYVISPPLVERIAQIDNICAIKNVGGIEHTSEIRRLVGDQIVVSDPSEENWLLNMTFYGQQVFMAGPSVHLYQWKDHLPMKRYTELAMQGRVEEAKEVSASMDPLREVAKRWIWEPWHHGNLPFARLKYWQELMGLAGGYVRPPLREMTEEEKKAFRQDFERAGVAVAA